MTETREQMEARHAAEIEALEAREVDPLDWWEAGKAFIEAATRADSEAGLSVTFPTMGAIQNGLIAALPLAPRQAMGEAEIEALADKIYEE